MNKPKHVRRRIALLVVATATLLGAAPIGSAGALDRADAPVQAQTKHLAKLEPSRGAYLGLYYGDGSVASTDKAIGRSPKVHLSYFGWKEDWTAAKEVHEDLRAGRIPLVNWEPFDVKFTDIVRGKYDALITSRAKKAKALKHRFFLDFAAEMNGDEGWGDHKPALYIKTWRHIHDIFTRNGATNAVWVWAPNCADVPGTPPATAYYPGDAYVDWTGIDGYNWGDSTKDFVWETFAQVFDPIYRDLKQYGKPVLIAETASDDRGGSKAKWISDIVPTVQHRFPLIHAVVWFDIQKERNWRFRSTATSLAAFKKLAASPYFTQH